MGAFQTEVISVQKTESSCVWVLLITEVISVLKTESNPVWELFKTEVISVQKTESHPVRELFIKTQAGSGQVRQERYTYIHVLAETGLHTQAVTASIKACTHEGEHGSARQTLVASVAAREALKLVELFMRR